MKRWGFIITHQKFHNYFSHKRTPDWAPSLNLLVGNGNFASEAAKTTRLWFMDSNSMKASDLPTVHIASQNREIGDL
jgi:hypothetical protein